MEAICALIGFSSRVLRASRDELQLHDDAFSSKSGSFGQIVSRLLQCQENILCQKEKHFFVWSFITDSCMLFLSLIDQIQLNIPHPRRWRYNVKSRIAKETYICVNWVPFSMGGSGVDYVSHQFPPAY